MKPFLVVRDADIFENPLEEPKEYVTRPTAKGLVFDADGNMALITTHEHYGLPGGGVEKGETFEQALIRECEEEIGCKVEINSNIGTSEQYRTRDAVKYETEYFTATVMGEKGMPTSTQDDEQNIRIIWIPVNEAVVFLSEQIKNLPAKDYSFKFNARTHIAAVEKYCKENHA
jgi:ADP-ribose pyrophosphatase YjhB (NUDIX family)